MNTVIWHTVYRLKHLLYTTMSELISFELPSSDPAFGEFNPRDSIVLTVVAKTKDGETKTTTPKFAVSDLY